MRYSIERDSGTKWRVLFIFDRDPIIDEVGNLAYSQGDVSRLEDPTKHLMHQFLDIVEDGNIKRVDRDIRLAISRCEMLLHKWTRRRMRRNFSMDNRMPDGQEILMELTVDSGFSETVAESLLHHIHEYITVFILRDWAGITYKEGYDYWDMRLRDTEEHIQECLEYGEDDEDAVLAGCW